MRTAERTTVGIERICTLKIGTGKLRLAPRRASRVLQEKDVEQRCARSDNKCFMHFHRSEYKGDSRNILTFVGALFILTPLGLLVFAYTSYGTLWG
jgi:hypothetical protein